MSAPETWHHVVCGAFGLGSDRTRELERAGFVDIQVCGDHNDDAPTAGDAFLVFAAHRKESG